MFPGPSRVPETTTGRAGYPLVGVSRSQEAGTPHHSPVRPYEPPP